MTNLFEMLYSNIIKESLQVPRSVFEELTQAIVSVYKRIQIHNVKRLTTKSAPPMEFKIDFKGTRWEFLNQYNPRIKMYFSNGKNNTYFSPKDPFDSSNTETIRTGKGYFVIDFKDGLHRVISEVLEHEFGHFIQQLIKTHRLLKGEKAPEIGGLPSKRFIPDTVTTHGYKIHKPNKKIQEWSMYRDGKQIWMKQSKRGKYVIIKTAKGETEEAAIQGIKKIGVNMDGITLKKMSSPDQYPRSQKRVEHSHRPVEYWTDLLSMLRILQYNYHNEPAGRFDKKTYFKTFLSEVYSLKFISLKNMSLAKNILNRFKAMDQKFYHHILSRLYNIFINKDYTKDYEEIKTILQRTSAEIEAAKMRGEGVKRPTVTEEIPLGLSEEHFTAQPIKQDVLDFVITDLDDENYETSEEIMEILGFRTKPAKDGYNYYNIPMNYATIRKIFKKLRDKIEGPDGPKASGRYKAEKMISNRKLYYDAARNLFEEIKLQLLHNPFSFQTSRKAIPDELFQHWIGLPLTPS